MSAKRVLSNGRIRLDKRLKVEGLVLKCLVGSISILENKQKTNIYFGLALNDPTRVVRANTASGRRTKRPLVCDRPAACDT